MTEAEIAEVKAVIANSALRSIDHHELSARRTDAASPEGEVTTDGKLNIEVQQRFAEGEFGVRLRAHVVLPIGEATAVVAGEYELQNKFVPRRAAVQMFMNEVAIMTVLPYVREAIASITTRVLGAPVYMPIVERGDITVDVDETDEGS